MAALAVVVSSSNLSMPTTFMLTAVGGSQDEDLAAFVKFRREAAGIEPWGSVPAAPAHCSASKLH